MPQATLNGILTNDGGYVCDVFFQWGSDTSYGMTTPKQGGAYTGTTFSVVIAGLTGGASYHYRAVAINSRGTVYGVDQVLTTRSPSFLPVMVGFDVLVLGR